MPSRPENLKAGGPLPVPGPISIDPSVEWVLTTPFGIQAGTPQETDSFAGPWFSGHLNDVMVIPAETGFSGLPALLAGADSGGVWNVGPTISVIPVNSDPDSPNPPSPTSQCLSNDWEVPGVVCFCAGPGAQHVYAGTSDVLNGIQTGYIYETVATGGVYNIQQWRPVPNASGQIVNFSTVYRIVVLEGPPSRIVLATNIGVFWANIPTPGGNYAWQQVTKMANGTTFPSGEYSGLAPGPSGSVVAAAFGSNSVTGLFGIFCGDWSTGSLVMTRATVPSAGPVSLTTFDQEMYRTSLAASAANPKVIYAIAAGISATIQCVIRSDDGGHSWIKPYDPTGANPAAAPIVFSRFDTSVSGSLFVHAGGQGPYNQAIAVSPADASANTLAIGWQSGTYVSTDGGSIWEFMEGSDHGIQLHSDVHGLYFDPTDKTGQTLYVCSDGGLAVTRDLGKTFDSRFNECLATLQLYSTTSMRDFYGTMSVAMPLVAAGSQDNGDLMCAVEGHYYAGVGLPQPTPGPWVKFNGCDGGPVAFLGTAPTPLFFPVNPPTFVQSSQVVSGAVCGGVGQPLSSQQVQPSFMWNFTNAAVVPIRTAGQKDNTSGQVVAVEATRAAPKIKNAAGQAMYAVAGGGSLNVWGLFANADGSDPNFELIGTLQSPVIGDTVSAIGSLDGTAVFAGTGSGRMYKFTPSPGHVVAAQSLPVTLPASVPQGAVQRIVVVSNSVAFATFNNGWSGRLLKFNGTSWTITDSALPGGAYFGLECDDTGAQLFAAAADRPFVSRDGGTTWLDCSTGLPKQPHCSDLRFGRDSTGAGWLFLSTFGRSAWQALVDPVAKIKPPVVDPPKTPVTGSGH